MERITGPLDKRDRPLAQSRELPRAHEGAPTATPRYPNPALSDAVFLPGKKSRHAKAELVKRPDLLHCSTPTKKRPAAFVTVYHDGPKIRKAYFTTEGQSVSIKNDQPTWKDFAQFQEVIEGSRDSNSPSAEQKQPIDRQGRQDRVELQKSERQSVELKSTTGVLGDAAEESHSIAKSGSKVKKPSKIPGEIGLAKILEGYGFLGFLTKERLQHATKEGARRCGIQVLGCSRFRLFYSAGEGKCDAIYVTEEGYHYPANGGQPEPVTAYLDRQWSKNI
jgi:hypothetical protein